MKVLSVSLNIFSHMLKMKNNCDCVRLEDERYFRDDSEDRLRVFGSVFAVFILNIVCLLAVFFLCPRDKSHVHQLKKELGKSKFLAKVYLVVFVLMYLFSFVYLLLMMNRQFQCWIVLGGNGC